MLFDVRTRSVGEWEVVAVVGDVDLATLPALRSAVSAAGGDKVAVDLGGVDLFDPLAFGVLLAASLQLRRRDARFAVVCPPGRPRELLAESEVDRILTVVDDAEGLAAQSL